MAPKPAPRIRTWACKGREKLQLCSEWPDHHEDTSQNPISPASFPGDPHSNKYHHGHQETGVYLTPHPHWLHATLTSLQLHSMTWSTGKARKGNDWREGSPSRGTGATTPQAVKCQREEGTALPLLQHPMRQTRAGTNINRGSFAVAGSLFLQSSSAASASG